MNLVIGISLLIIGILVNNYSVSVRKNLDYSKNQNLTISYLFLLLFIWVAAILISLFILFKLQWWLPILALIIGARFVRR